MTWFRVDDSLAFHHKVVGVGNSAMGLWVRAGAWCAQQLNDGHVPAHMVKALGGASRDAKALVAYGLWEEDGPFYVFNDWHQYQPTSAEVKAARLAKSEKRAEAGRAGGIASGVARRANAQAEPDQAGSKIEASGEANGKQNEAPSLPGPSLPSQPLVVTPRKRATATPDLFPITEQMAAWGRANCPNVLHPNRETRQFLDHHRAKGSTMRDWTAAWRTWMTNAQKFALRDGGKPIAVPSGDPLTAWAREQG